MAARKQERIFNRTGWRHYRRTYSLTEVRVGMIILVGLAVITVWVVWRGAHPDPELFSVSATLLDEGGGVVPVDREVASEAGRREGAEVGAATGGRGPVPDQLTAAGWQEGKLAHFGPDNLYEKIDGREGYYKSFGFQHLHYVSLQAEGDGAAVVDIEMYDLGTVANALGAYAGERPPESAPEVSDDGISHLARNALLLVRGKYYVRAIGSDESEVVVAELRHLQARFDASLAGEPLPWAYSVFVGQLGIDPGKIRYQPENAFSFGFATNVYSAEVTDDGAELFVVAASDAAAAKKLASRFSEGFRSYGAAADSKGTSGVTWIADQYLHTIAGATASGVLVIGVRGAPDVEFARTRLEQLEATVAALPASLLERAVAEKTDAGGQPAGDDHGAGDRAGDDEHDLDSPGGEPGEGEGEGMMGEPSYDPQEGQP